MASSSYAAVSSRLITGRVFNEEEDDLLDTVHDFSSAMYDNFHHLAPEIIEAFGSLCGERRHRVHIVLGAVQQRRQLRSYLPSHTRSNRSNGLSIQSRFATRAFQTPTTIEIRLYTQADGMMAQPVTVCTCEAVNKAIDQWKGIHRQMLPDPSG
jgi:hypothetical protein